MDENRWDSFVLFRFSGDDAWRLFSDKPLTKYGCENLVLGLQHSNPQMEYVVVTGQSPLLTKQQKSDFAD